MNPSNTVILGLLCPLLLIASSASAHIPFIEPETRAPDPAALTEAERAVQDYSFENPFPLPEDLAFQAANGFSFDGIDSMAINAYLTANDVDVYRQVPADNEGFVFPAILASVLVPACAELDDAYPVVALVGPGLPRDAANIAKLPFDIDDADQVPQPATGKNGVLYAPSPPEDRREFFVEDVITGLSWFLPKGLTQECLEPPGNPFADCETFENTIVATTAEGMKLGENYYVAVWDPTGRAQDYTMNLGVTDDHYVDRPDLNAEIQCFGQIHGTCSQPYPDEPAPEGYFSPVCEAAPGGDAGGDTEADAGGDTSAGGDSGGGSSGDSGCAGGEATTGWSAVLLALWLGGLMLWRRRRLALA